MANRRIAQVQPVAFQTSSVRGTDSVPDQSTDWSRRGRLASWAMLVAALVYVAHYPHDSIEVVQGTARYLVAWLLLASILAMLSFPPVRALDRWIDWLCIGLGAMMTYALFGRSGEDVNLRLGANELGWWWAMASFIPLARRVAADREAAWWLFRLGITIAVAQAVVGWHQKLIDLPDLIAQYRQDPDRMLRMFGIPTDQPSAMKVRFENRLFDGGPTGTFALANSLAALLVGGLVAIIACAWHRVPHRSWRWAVWFVAAGLVTTMLVSTASRAALAALLLVGVAVAAAFALRSRWVDRMKHQPLVILGSFGAALATAGVGVYVFRTSEFVSQAPASLAIRLNYWRASLGMLAQHPWDGIGPGQFKLVYEQFRAPESNEQIADPHQFLLQVATAGGVPAFVVFTLLLALWCWTKLSPRSVQATENDSTQPKALPLFAPASNEQTATFWAATGLALTVVWLGGLITNQLPAPQALMVGTLAGLAVAGALFSSSARVDREGPATHSTRSDDWFRGSAAWAGVSILITLLAAGGLTVPGISLALWAWLAVASPVSWQVQVTGALADSELTDRSVRRSSSVFKRPGIGFASALGLVLVTWYWLGIRPVEQAKLNYQRYLAESERGLDAQVAEALEACWDADPWDSQIAVELAAVYRQLGEGDPAQRADWDRKWQYSEQRALAGAGPDAVMLMRLGDLRLERYQLTGEPAMLTAANSWYERATEKSPSHETYAAQFAETLRALGEPRAAVVARRAQELSLAGGYYERSLPFTMIRPAVYLGGQSENAGKLPIKPASELLAPLLTTPPAS